MQDYAPLSRKILQILFYPLCLIIALLIIDVTTVWFINHVVLLVFRWVLSAGFFWRCLIIVFGLTVLYGILSAPLIWVASIVYVGLEKLFSVNNYTKMVAFTIVGINFIYMIYFLFHTWHGWPFWNIKSIIFILIYLSIVFTYNFSFISLQFKED